MQLSKSSLVRSIQCAKSLYLYKYNYHLRDKPSVHLQHKFNRGHQIGKLAWQLFPNGKDVSPSSPSNFSPSIKATQLLLQQNFPIIYEAAFKYNGLLAAIDILENKNGIINIYEVKSSLKISNTYLQDCAIQYYILKQNKISINDFSIIHINSDYTLNDSLDLDSYFVKTSVLEKIEALQPYIAEKINEAIQIVTTTTMPTIDIGGHCLKPYTCDFYGTCWKDVATASFWNLQGISLQQKEAWQQKKLQTIYDVKANSLLNTQEKLIVSSYQKQQIKTNPSAIKKYLQQIKYPIAFFDIEAYQPAIPTIKGTKPYERIPFLYSIHLLENKDATTTHHYFMIANHQDNRKAFITQFLKDTTNCNSIVVFNDLLEKNILHKFSVWFPELKSEIDKRIDKIIDLEIIFKNYWYYHYNMMGSLSLKTISNALSKQDIYDNSTIKDGAEAMSIFNDIELIENVNQKKKLVKQLVDYCSADTAVLVKLFHFLQQQVI
ncbi:MAG: DUF2779 domain-containing protein [Chitinophagales bacterium]|nr:DUF2779 domain-containing protein [Chitinophagales bacterium]